MIILYFFQAVIVIGWLFFCCTIGILVSPFLRWNTNLTHYLSWLWGTLAFRALGIKVIKENFEAFETKEPRIYVSNHQNTFDIVAFGTHFPKNTVCIAKMELLVVPIFGWFFYATNHILIRRSRKDKARNSMDEAARRIRENGVSIFMFPEGTRNRTSEPLQPFKKGAFHLAMQTNVPVVPFIAEPYRHLIDGSKNKLEIKTLRLRVLEPIHPKDYSTVEEFSDAVRKSILNAFEDFEKPTQL